MPPASSSQFPMSRLYGDSRPSVTVTVPLPSTHRNALVGGHRLAYLDEGSGPPVLLIHGIPTSSLLWRQVIPVLTQTHRVIAPDMLNFGKSAKPVDADVSIAAQSRLMVKVLDALGVARADVVAHDIGGGVAQLMAVNGPLARKVRDVRIGLAAMALILTYPTFLVPFCTWLLMGYFRSIPYELEECALIDGASRWQILTKITLPLAVPGLISAGIFAFTLSWNEFLYALVFIHSPENKTIPVGVTSELIKGDVFFWGSLMAGALFLLGVQMLFDRVHRTRGCPLTGLPPGAPRPGGTVFPLRADGGEALIAPSADVEHGGDGGVGRDKGEP